MDSGEDIKKERRLMTQHWSIIVFSVQTKEKGQASKSEEDFLLKETGARPCLFSQTGFLHWMTQLLSDADKPSTPHILLIPPLPYSSPQAWISVTNLVKQLNLWWLVWAWYLMVAVLSTSLYLIQILSVYCELTTFLFAYIMEPLVKVFPDIIIWN